MSEGKKYDSGKPRWSLLPDGAVARIVAVLEAGARKYSENNWQLVPDGKTRYYDAAMRHLEAWRSGELNDPETGLPHLAHAGCCMMFLGWLDTEGQKESTPRAPTIRAIQSMYVAAGCAAQRCAAHFMNSHNRTATRLYMAPNLLEQLGHPITLAGLYVYKEEALKPNEIAVGCEGFDTLIKCQL